MGTIVLIRLRRGPSAFRAGWYSHGRGGGYLQATSPRSLEKVGADGETYEDIVDESPSVEERLSERQTSYVVQDLLSNLKPREQSVVRKRMTGMALKDIADEFGLSREAVRRDYIRAIDRMRVDLERRGLSFDDLL